ncbi:MAG: light-harvesting antenna LH1, alpha subunit [Candidatus Velthaea sp.]|jgi:hypothetical protein
MIIRRPYNFRATLGAYVLAGVVVAFLIHFIVLSSPKYNWIFPAQTSGTGTSTQVNPAPGAK